jgi:hypothetical protein
MRKEKKPIKLLFGEGCQWKQAPPFPHRCIMAISFPLFDLGIGFLIFRASASLLGSHYPLAPTSSIVMVEV